MKTIVAIVRQNHIHASEANAVTEMLLFWNAIVAMKKQMNYANTKGNNFANDVYGKSWKR